MGSENDSESQMSPDLGGCAQAILSLISVEIIACIATSGSGTL